MHYKISSRVSAQEGGIMSAARKFALLSVVGRGAVLKLVRRGMTPKEAIDLLYTDWRR